MMPNERIRRWKAAYERANGKKAPEVRFIGGTFIVYHEAHGAKRSDSDLEWATEFLIGWADAKESVNV